MSILSEKWLWIIIIALISISLIPFVIIWILLALPHPLNAVVIILLISAWSIVAGYKEWILFKKDEEKTKRR